MTKTPEPWLRGPIEGIPALLQPVAHALIAAREGVEDAVRELPADRWWMRGGGAASVGFHVAHLAGSTDRLLTYARGEALTDRQKAALAREKAIDDERPPPDDLLREWVVVVERALGQLRATPETALTDERLVGRARLPSTVMGLLFHAAEHASRHTGQIVTTLKVLEEGPHGG